MLETKLIKFRAEVWSRERRDWLAPSFSRDCIDEAKADAAFFAKNSGKTRIVKTVTTETVVSWDE